MKTPRIQTGMSPMVLAAMLVNVGCVAGLVIAAVQTFGGFTGFAIGTIASAVWFAIVQRIEHERVMHERADRQRAEAATQDPPPGGPRRFSTGASSANPRPLYPAGNRPIPNGGNQPFRPPDENDDGD